MQIIVPARETHMLLYLKVLYCIVYFDSNISHYSKINETLLESKSRSPAWTFCKADMKNTKVDQSISSQSEVGQQA